MENNTIDWEGFLKDRVPNPGGVTEEEQRYMDYSNSWVTCVFGYMDDRIPSLSAYNAAPLDHNLRELGSTFTTAMRLRNYPLAREIRRQMLEREKFLLENVYA